MRAQFATHVAEITPFKARCVRLSTAHLRSAVAARVTSIAAPSSRASDTGPLQDTGRVPSKSAHGNAFADRSDAAAPHHSSDNGDSILASANSDQVANLERARSSRNATTSSAASQTPGGRKRAAVSPDSTQANGVSRTGSSRRRTTSRTREFQPREYTAQLTAAESISELQQLFEVGRQHDINAIHIATLWTRLAKLVSATDRRSAAASRRAAGSVDGAQDTPSPSSSPSMILTPSKAASASRQPQTQQQPQPSQQQEQQEQQQQQQQQQQQLDPAQLAAFVQELQACTTPQQLESMEARGLANVVWAAAKLKPQQQEGSAPSTQRPSSSASGPQDHPNGTAGEVSSSGEGQEQQRQRPLRVRGGKKALEAAKAAAAAAEGEGQQHQQRTTLVSEELLDAWTAAAGSKLRNFSMQDISNVVWALGRLGYHPRGLFMKQLSIALLKELPRADRPQQLSNVLLGLALLRFVPPIRDFWAAVWVAVGRLVLADSKTPDVQAVSNTLWSLNQLRAHCGADMAPVPPELVSRAVFRAVQWGDKLSATQLQDVLVSLHPLGFEPSEYQASKLLALARRVLPDSDAQALSNLLMSLLQMHVRPTAAWMVAYLDAFEGRLHASKGEALARLVYTMGKFGSRPPAWIPKLWAKLEAELPSMSASDIAFAIMGIRSLYPKLPLWYKGATSAAEVEEEEGDASAAAAAASGEGAGEEEEDAASTQAGDAEGKGKKRLDGSKLRLKWPPSRRLLVALRRAWEGVGHEAQLSVTFEYRATVQEFLNAALEE
ncbi:hypothetical protein Agub_g6395 [Astrephomene gubernaculifera]|uniref:Uncharacterized protein n=1 Tax=Astrephomene gubernaculifera TaxID=47775 RepID=A0AAD3DQV6_9CHLO|nr:hypothetical protein Agub_g6395 [Astrephomene gubernaculifera]